MKEGHKTKEQLINELAEARRRIAELEASEAERKQAEEELQKSQKELQTLMDASPVAISWADLEGNILYKNRKHHELFGYTREEIPTVAEWQRQVHYDSAQRERFDLWMKKVSKAKKHGGSMPPPQEMIAICKDGSIRHVTVEVAVVSDRTLVIYNDITERKQMEDELRESEERFRRLIETMKVGLSAIDENGVINYANERLSEMWGYPMDEIIGRSTFDFIDEENLKILKEHLSKRKKGSRESYEITWTRKDGGKVPTILSPTPNFDADGRYKGSYGFITDITERKRMEESLQESEERFRILAEYAPLGISIMAPDKSFEYLNPRFTEIFGYTIEDIPDKDTWFQKAYPDEAYRKKLILIWKRDTAEALKIGKENPRVFTVRCKNGQDKIIDFRRIDLKNGKQYQIYDDITVRTKAEEALRENEERYRSLVENIDLGINLIDSEYNILMVNAALSKRLKQTASELIGKKCYRELEKRDAACPHCPGVQTMATGKPAEAETEVIRDDGSHSQLRLQSFPLFGQDGTVTSFIELVEDITESKRIEKLEYLATHDFLTGLPNRFLFNDRLTLALAQTRRRQQKLCVMLLDLDHFKDINDTFGHSAGDKLLRVIGKLLIEVLREGDTVARIGGDEFLLLLPDLMSIENATTIAQKILEILRADFEVDNRRIYITTSIGIAIFPDDGEDADTLVKNADAAMYRAKERGRDNFQCYTPT
jgi:diguanylate cyclase (GGDEF)-like protein/PAS domain S-box-containing protein